MDIQIVNPILQEDLDDISSKFIKGELSDFQKIGSGSYGTVYGYKDYAIKLIYNEDDGVNRDIEVLKDISHLPFIPTLYAIINNKVLISERIYGKTVEMYTCRKENPYNIDERILDEWHNCLFTIIREGYSPDDLHENNVMISRDGRIKIVDVGWFFKHGQEPNHYNETSVRSEYGYERAEVWSGNALKRYIHRLEEQRKENLMAMGNYGKDGLQMVL